jgi:hypothetical protein
MEETPTGEQVSADHIRFVISERVSIEAHRRTWLEEESWHFGVFRGTGQIIEFDGGRVGEVCNYLGGGDTLEEALSIARPAAAEVVMFQASLF